MFGFPAFLQSFGVPSRTVAGRLEIPPAWQMGLLNGSRSAQIVGLVLSGYVTERFGYKRVIFVALVFMSGFIAIETFATNLEMVLAGELLLGVPCGSESRRRLRSHGHARSAH